MVRFHRPRFDARLLSESQQDRGRSREPFSSSATVLRNPTLSPGQSLMFAAGWRPGKPWKIRIESGPGLLNEQVPYDICSSMGNPLLVRNTFERQLWSRVGDLRRGFRSWGGKSLVPCGGQIGALRSLHTLRSPRASSALWRFIRELRGHMRWWAHGAFGNKGRLEGGQYRAGRRAPPLLSR